MLKIMKRRKATDYVLNKEEEIMIMDHQNEIIQTTRAALVKNGFDVWYAKDIFEAKEIFWNEIYDTVKPQSFSWGDSLTVSALGLIDALKQKENLVVFDPFDEKLSRQKQIENRNKALTVDLFLTGTNALTTKGQLVNLDMVGNRIGGIAFGPKDVVLFIGVNKIVESLDDAFLRIKTISAPKNAIRHPALKTPCQKTGVCMDCSSPDRICNTWLITEKAYPKGRIKIVLINETLGI